MKYLLDTHVLIWAIFDDTKLPDAICCIINNPKNEIYCSVASLWETTIKHDKFPDKIPISGGSLLRYCTMSDINVLPIIAEHAIGVSKLNRIEGAPPHNDPFDRLLISQAKTENMILITHDKLLEGYGEECVETF